MSRNTAHLPLPDLFSPPPQGDLFASQPAPARYAPKPEYVRSSLDQLLARLAAAQNWWIWTDWDIERFRERDPAFFCALLRDEAEANLWRARVQNEIARLNAASGTARPQEHSGD